MTRNRISLLIALATVVMANTGVVVAAPVPKERMPDPLAWAFMGVRVESTNSLQVASTEPGTPATLAGVLPNDIIVRVGNLTPQSFDEVALYVIALRPGTRLLLEVRRNGELVTLPLILGERPSDTPLNDAIMRRLYQRPLQIDD